MMGTGEAEGEDRAQKAADMAISNPLLDDVTMKGAKGVLINITGGPDLMLFEVEQAANRIRAEVDPDANIIFGNTILDEWKAACASPSSPPASTPPRCGCRRTSSRSAPTSSRCAVPEVKPNTRAPLAARQSGASPGGSAGRRAWAPSSARRSL